MPNLLLTFDTKVEREKFVEFLGDLKTQLGEIQEDDAIESHKLVTKALQTVKLDPSLRTPEERQCAVFVQGQEVSRGNFSLMQERFKQEIGVHSANTELREDEESNGKFSKVLRSRKKQ